MARAAGCCAKLAHVPRRAPESRACHSSGLLASSCWHAAWLSQVVHHPAAGAASDPSLASLAAGSLPPPHTGTTGKPKGVALSHAALHSQSMAKLLTVSRGATPRGCFQTLRVCARNACSPTRPEAASLRGQGRPRSQKHTSCWHADPRHVPHVSLPSGPWPAVRLLPLGCLPACRPALPHRRPVVGAGHACRWSAPHLPAAI